jgi:hypothetical protein
MFVEAFIRKKHQESSISKAPDSVNAAESTPPSALWQTTDRGLME